ncbi:MAG: ATP-binding protein [Bacillota bacterium]|nr:ATP-binding protein [Bacillota bacterium]
MRRSLQWRLVFIFMLITFSLMLFIGVTLNSKVESSYYSNFQKNIESYIGNWDILTKNPTDDAIRADLNEGKNAVYTFRVSDVGYSMTVINKKTNKIVYSSDKRYKENNDSFLYQSLKSSNLTSVMAGQIKGNGDKHANNDSDTPFFDYAYSNGNYILYFRYYRTEWGSIIDNFNNIVAVTCVFAVLASLVLGYILSKTITIPVVNIMHKAEKLALGNFDQALPVKSEDEIGKLTSTFNYMAGELKNTLGEISNEKNKVEAILNYMTDGVIAFNIKGEVIHINPAARTALGAEDFNESFNSFAATYNLGITLEEILYIETAGRKEKIIDAAGKRLRVYFVLFKGEEDKAGGVIVVLQDITEQQKLEDMRKEFVANVSHELRTPLTSIKSYAETLLDGAMEDSETALKFLGIINSEADRMTRLVRDLLQLTRIENQQVQWNMKSVNVAGLVADAVEKLQMEAKNKNLTMANYVIGEIPEINADYDRLEQVILNILSNAMKYTTGGGKITVYTSRVYNDIYVKVADTGIGIPKDDLDRIFERFYRVDKARSREMGGTGLGLSIAKEIVEAHGGSINAVSELGKGTEITVILPIVIQT